MLIGVSASWKTSPAAEIVTTSLKMPAIESVTTDVRCKSANSEDVIQKAMTPGKRMIRGPRTGPLFSKRTCRPCHKAGKPSTGIAIRKREVNIIGAR